MKIHLDFDSKHWDNAQAKLLGAYNAKSGKGVLLSWSDKELAKEFTNVKAAANFKAAAGSVFHFTSSNGETIKVIGMGEKSKAKAEGVRRAIATAYKSVAGEKYDSVALDLASFNAVGNLGNCLELANEALILTSYKFENHKSEKTKNSFKEFCFYIADKKIKRSADKIIEKSTNLAESVNYARDLVLSLIHI